MSTSERWFPSHLMPLTEAECIDLLESREVGRVAYCDELGPVVLPVNFVLDGHAVLIQISPHTKLARHLWSTPAAFQIDEFDDYTQSGWSVLVRGDATWVDATDLPAADRLQPWAEGQRTLHVRIEAREITGRRLVGA